MARKPFSERDRALGLTVQAHQRGQRRQVSADAGDERREPRLEEQAPAPEEAAATPAAATVAPPAPKEEAAYIVFALPAKSKTKP